MSFSILRSQRFLSLVSDIDAAIIDDSLAADFCVIFSSYFLIFLITA